MDAYTLKLILILTTIFGLCLIYFIGVTIFYCYTKRKEEYEKVNQDPTRETNTNRESYVMIP